MVQIAVHPVQELVDNEEDEREAWKTSNFMNSCCRMDTVIKLIKGVIFVCFFYQKKRICYFQTFMSLFSQPKVLCSDSVLSYYCRCVTSRSYFVLHNN